MINSMIFLCYGHLELAYEKLFGYITITLHYLIWLVGALYSGYLDDTTPSEVIYGLVVIVPLHLLYYGHKVSREFDEIERKILLEISESNIMNLVNAVPEGIVVVDNDSKTIMKNETYEKLVQGAQFSNIKFIEKYHQKENLFKENFLECLNEFNKTSKISIKFGVFFEKSAFIECTGTKIIWNNNDCIVLTFREITNIVSLEKEVNERSKTIKILRGVSHELKTPMNYIINQLLELLHSSFELKELAKCKLKQSISMSQYLLSLIRDMIDYSYIKSNNFVTCFK